ncbi:hypothetical protein FBULB1_9380 [Fusarium bulbicola]|nr:hypothetical protein FBULB1_9380 [Fusarium bulbicola]
MDLSEADHDTASQDAVDALQPVDFPYGASDDSLDSSQAQDAPERGTAASPERVFKICGLCKFPFHKGQAIITIDRKNSTQPLTWNDKYYPKHWTTGPGGNKAFHVGCFKIAGDFIFVKGFLESCTWNLLRLDIYISWILPPPSAMALRTRRLDEMANIAERTRWSMFPTTVGPDDFHYNYWYGEPVNAIDWNLPEVSGYVIGLNLSSIYFIIPYQSGKLPRPILDAYDHSHVALWLYFPVDPVERISELWRRSVDVSYDRGDQDTRVGSLIIVTNKGRSLVLGPDVRSCPTRNHLTYKALANLPSEDSTRSFYYKYQHDESWLGFKNMPTWDKREVELSLGSPPGTNPYCRTTRFFATSAELADIKTIAPCSGWRNCGDNDIFGLLFTYLDGRQRSFWLGSSDGATDPHDDEESPSEMDRVLAHEAASGEIAEEVITTFPVAIGDMDPEVWEYV